MKFKKYLKKPKVVSVILIFILITVQISFPVHYNNIKSIYLKDDDDKKKLNESNFWSLPYIHINNNWTETKTTYEWCDYKDGYYVIENVIIDNLNERGIIIENTNDRFILKNCSIKLLIYLSTAIKLYNVSNGILLDNILSECYKGFYLVKSNNITISENIINASRYSGIELLESNNCAIYKNNLCSELQGILITICENVSIEQNFINEYRYYPLYGIYINYSNNCEVINNSIYADLVGIDLSRAKGNVIKENKVYDNEWGIALRFSNNNTILSNTAEKSNQYGIALISSSENKIIENFLHYARDCGLYLKESHNNSIIKNSIISRKNCIIEINCSGNMFIQNKCKIINQIQGYQILPLLCLNSLAVILILRKYHLKKFD